MTAALDQETCRQILEECGFVPKSGVVSLYKIPRSLNAKQTEQYLRKRGAELCG